MKKKKQQLTLNNSTSHWHGNNYCDFTANHTTQLLSFTVQGRLYRQGSVCQYTNRKMHQGQSSDTSQLAIVLQTTEVSKLGLEQPSCLCCKTNTSCHLMKSPVIGMATVYCDLTANHTTQLLSFVARCVGESKAPANQRRRRANILYRARVTSQPYSI